MTTKEEGQVSKSDVMRDELDRDNVERYQQSAVTAQHIQAVEAVAEKFFADAAAVHVPAEPPQPNPISQPANEQSE